MLACLIAAAVELGEGPRQETHHEDCPENAEPREGIGAAVKDLGHSWPTPSAVPPVRRPRMAAGLSSPSVCPSTSPNSEFPRFLSAPGDTQIPSSNRR